MILSNGNIHYFWNIYKGNPQIIVSFPSCESVKGSKALNADPSRLYNEEVITSVSAFIYHHFTDKAQRQYRRRI